MRRLFSWGGPLAAWLALAAAVTPGAGRAGTPAPVPQLAPAAQLPPAHSAPQTHPPGHGKEPARPKEEGPAPAASSGPAALGLAELEQLALQRNPTLAQAAAQVEASRAKALQAGLYPNPRAGYQADQIGIAGTAGELQGAFVQQEIVTAGKLRLGRAK